MKALRLVLITSMCALMANVLSAQVKIGENKLQSSPEHWLEIDFNPASDSLFIITKDQELGMTNNPHRPGPTNPNVDAMMLKLYGYGLNNFFPSVTGVSQDFVTLNGEMSNVFLGISDAGQVMEVPLRLVIEADTSTANLSLFNGIDTFGTADLTALDSLFATDNELRDSTALLRTLISNVQSADQDTITGNEYIDSIRLSNDTIHFIENIAGRLAPRNDQFVDLGPLLQGATFYLTDGELEENRTVSGGASNHWLRFVDVDTFEVDANSFVVLNGFETTIQQNGQDVFLINAAEEVKFRSSSRDSILVLDEDGSLHATLYGDTIPALMGDVATILAVDPDGNIIETTIEEILAEQIDSTIYNSSGTLISDRTLDGDGGAYDLSFVQIDALTDSLSLIHISEPTRPY